MEQQATSTSTVTNVQITGVPSDPSSLDSLRIGFQRNESHQRPKSASAVTSRTSELRVNESMPTHKPNVCELTKPKLRSKWTLTHKRDQSSVEARLKLADASNSSDEIKSSTRARHAPVASTTSSATQPQVNTQHSSSTPIDIGAQPARDLITRNNRVRRILERVDWTKLRGDTVQGVAKFQEFEDAETKFQEFQSFIKAEGKYLGLPEGCKPFERVLVQGREAGSNPYPYIRFTNFRTEEDVRKYHSALSKRKIKQQYHPPLRLCYEIQRLRYHAGDAGDAGTDVEGDSGETLCGKTAVIEDGDTRRLVTIGGLVQVDNKLYAMTSGHDASSGDDVQRVPETDSSFGTATDEVEYDVDIESALICGEPGTNSGVDWDTDRAGRNDQDRATESATLRFHGSSMAGEDWSLQLIENPLLALPNSFPGIHGVTTRYMTYPASQPLSGPVWLLAGVSGARIVHMLPGIMTFPLPSGNWISAWKVSLVVLRDLEDFILLILHKGFTESYRDPKFYPAPNISSTIW